jgi:flagellar protein FliJ
MSNHVTLVSKRFAVMERARKVAALETMITEFERIARQLEQEIALEEKLSGVHDPNSARYSTLAKATSQRHANLRRSVEELGSRLEIAKREYEHAQAELEVLGPAPEANQSRNKGEQISSEARTN